MHAEGLSEPDYCCLEINKNTVDCINLIPVLLFLF